MAKPGVGELFPLVGGQGGARFSLRDAFNGPDQTEDSARFDTWDRDAVETLTGFYELAAAAGADEARRPLPAGNETATATALGQSLLPTVNAAVDFTAQFEGLEARLANLLQSGGNASESGALRIVEAHVEEVAAQVGRAQIELERLNSIETLLAALVDRTAILQKVEHQLATPLSDGVCLDTAARLDDLNNTMQNFMDEQRRGTRSAMILLEAVQQAILRLIERADYSASQSPGSTNGPFRSASYAESAVESDRHSNPRRRRRTASKRSGKLGKALAMLVVACTSFHMTARSLATPLPEHGKPIAAPRLSSCCGGAAAGFEGGAVWRPSARPDAGSAESSTAAVTAARELAVRFAASVGP